MHPFRNPFAYVAMDLDSRNIKQLVDIYPNVEFTWISCGTGLLPSSLAAANPFGSHSSAALRRSTGDAQVEVNSTSNRRSLLLKFLLHWPCMPLNGNKRLMQPAAASKRVHSHALRLPLASFFRCALIELPLAFSACPSPLLGPFIALGFSMGMGFPLNPSALLVPWTLEIQRLSARRNAQRRRQKLSASC